MEAEGLLYKDSKLRHVAEKGEKSLKDDSYGQCSANRYEWIECRADCRDKKCTNKESQDGALKWEEKLNVVLMDSSKGVGVRAKEKLGPGIYLGDVTGEALTENETKKRAEDDERTTFLPSTMKKKNTTL